MIKRIHSFLLLFILGLTLSFPKTCVGGTLDNWNNPKAYKPRPVFFLHGFNSSPATWQTAISTLSSLFYKYQPIGAYLETIDFPDKTGSIDTYSDGKDGWADRLKKEMERLLANNKYGFYTKKLNLVSHSMGGLTAREFLTNSKYPTGTTDKLILIGVPNLGSPLASTGKDMITVYKIGSMAILPTTITFFNLRNNVDSLAKIFWLPSIEVPEGIKDMIPGSAFLNALNNRSQPSDVQYYGIYGIIGHFLNTRYFKNYYGGDGVVSKDSQLGGGRVTFAKEPKKITAFHTSEPALSVTGDNPLLKFLDSTKPELQITSPSSGSEIYETSIRIQGRVYKEYLPADTELTINVRRQEGGYVAPPQTSLLRPSNLWIPNNPDSPVAEFDEVVAFPGQGTYQVSLQAKNPAGETSDVKEVWVRVVVFGSANIIIHCHNPEGKEIASIQGMSQNSVAIYDGDTLIGYGAYNSATHNQPITISTGSHTIKVKFNGITLEQSISISEGETQVLTFTFSRISRDYGEIYDYSKTESIEYPTVEGIASPKYNMSSCSSGWNCNWPGCDLYSWNLDYGEELSIVHWSMSGGIEVKWERIGNHLTVMLKGHAWVTWEVPMDIMLALGVFNYHQPQFRGGYISKNITPYYGFDNFFIQLSNPSTNYYGLSKFVASTTTVSIEYPYGQGGVEDSEDLYNQNSRSFEGLTDLIREEYAPWTQAAVSSIPYDLTGSGI